MRSLLSAIAPLAAACVLVPVPAAAGNGDAILAGWYSFGRCHAHPFRGAFPVVRTGNEDLVVSIPGALQKPSATAWYLYDKVAHIAYRHVGSDSGLTETIRIDSPPPIPVPQTPLGASHTIAGLKLGSSEAAVVAALGKPAIVQTCGGRTLGYTRVREGQPDEIFFRIGGGRVVEILSETNG